MTALPALNLATLVPLLSLVGAAAGILLFNLWGAPWQFSAWVSLTSLAVAASLTLIIVASSQGGPVQGMLSGDGVAALFTLYFCGVGGAVTLIGLGSADVRDSGGYALVLLAISGALVVAQSVHVLPLAIGLTIFHTAASALIGPQAAWRHLIIQGVGLACLLLGTSFLYGATSSMQIEIMAESLARHTDMVAVNPLADLGRALILGGLALPLGVAPFHTWLFAAHRPAQSLGRLLLSLVLPATAIAALSRFVPVWSARSLSVLAAMGALSTILGYWTALRSRQVEDALIGIGIAQSGVLALSLVVASTADWTALFYVLSSNSLNLACLWATALNGRREDGHPLALTGIAGLGHRYPWLAGAVTLCTLSLAGLPPLASAMGQLHLYRVVASEGYGWAIGLACVGNLMAWLWTMRWGLTIWTRSLEDEAPRQTAPEMAVIAVVAAGATLWAGLYAETVLDWIARLAASR